MAVFDYFGYDLDPSFLLIDPIRINQDLQKKSSTSGATTKRGWGGGKGQTTKEK